MTCTLIQTVDTSFVCHNNGGTTTFASQEDVVWATVRERESQSPITADLEYYQDCFQTMLICYSCISYGDSGIKECVLNLLNRISDVT